MPVPENDTTHASNDGSLVDFKKPSFPQVPRLKLLQVRSSASRCCATCYLIWHHKYEACNSTQRARCATCFLGSHSGIALGWRRRLERLCAMCFRHAVSHLSNRVLGPRANLFSFRQIVIICFKQGASCRPPAALRSNCTVESYSSCMCLSPTSVQNVFI